MKTPPLNTITRYPVAFTDASANTVDHFDDRRMKTAATMPDRLRSALKVVGDRANHRTRIGNENPIGIVRGILA